ncbi:uncharacterized protein LOC134229254 [Saccostrea cucullata]|uniref:uncharacterized protein LOC134229254 n=1 Tax=Saccostrea cuccullata TaxID=36930 RepID=UPI002ED1AAE0
MLFEVCGTAAVFTLLMFHTAYGLCGVHQKLDIVILYDESSNAGYIGFDYQRQFIVALADALYITSSATNIAGVGVDDKAYYGWGLRDYFNSSQISLKMMNMTISNGPNSDLADGFNMAWNTILSKNARSGYQSWIIAITEKGTINSTTGLDAAKAAGVKVGILGGDPASSYTTIASDLTYIIGSMAWSALVSYVPTVVQFFCNLYCEDFDFYYDVPSTMSVRADNYSDVGYYLDGVDMAYNIHCCGAVSSVEFKATTSGTFKFQIWRKDVLVSETSISATGGYQSYTFSPKLAVEMMDVVGWYSPGVNPIGIATSCNGTLCTSFTRRAPSMGTVAVGSTYSWASAINLPDTAFAIKFTIVNVTALTFTMTSPVFISETLTVGSNVTTVSVTHDTGMELMYTDPSSPYFAFDQYTGLISLIGPLPVTNTETTYVLVIEVYDTCYNSATATLNITSYSVPPSFHNLPTEVEIGDDVTEETLLIVINATDESAPTITCTETSILPETQFFRLDDYMNGSAAVYLNADSQLDFNTAEEYKMFITCTGSSSLESILTIRILDKSVTTPYSVPDWAAGAIVVSVGSMGVVLGMVCFLIVVILATTDEAEALPPVEEEETTKTEVEDSKKILKNVDKKPKYREGRVF